VAAAARLWALTSQLWGALLWCSAKASTMYVLWGAKWRSRPTHPRGTYYKGRLICTQPRGTVARTTEMISEIHDLGDYISASSGEAPVEARDATEDRLGTQYQVCPYSIARC